MSQKFETDMVMWCAARIRAGPWKVHAITLKRACLFTMLEEFDAVTIDRGAKQIVGAGTATATQPTREHKQYATQGPTTYLCT